MIPYFCGKYIFRLNFNSLKIHVPQTIEGKKISFISSLFGKESSLAQSELKYHELTHQGIISPNAYIEVTLNHVRLLISVTSPCCNLILINSICAFTYDVLEPS